jgi:hypothetical protein
MRVAEQGKRAKVEHLHGKHGSGKDGGDAREQKVVGAIQFRGPVENFTQVKGAKLVGHVSLALARLLA